MSQPPRFWRWLLVHRQDAEWGNFSWLSASVLLQSANDQVAKLIDATIINRRRMRWMASQRYRGISADEPIQLHLDRGTGSSGSIVLLGDPGEMDASQYVLVRELIATNARALLLMSDIVYPAGNVNAWRDSVYLPYLGLPKWAWDSAIAEWSEAVGGAVPDHRPQPPPWLLFATPGNHDWYDSLSGFMFNASDADPLPEVVFSREGLSDRQVISRALWQRAARPDRSKLAPLKHEARRRIPDHDPDGHQVPGPVPHQPGPYFSIDARREDRLVRFVCVDTGIDGSIDVEQAAWIEGQLADASIPKVVVTGKPLVVDEKIARLPIDGGTWMDVGDERNPCIRNGKEVEGCRDLRDLMKQGESVVATVAGDIHNTQVIAFGSEVEPSSPRPARLYVDLEGGPRLVTADGFGLPPVQIVAGGGGAYLTATHGVRHEADGSLVLKDECHEQEITVPSTQHRRYPSREQSVLMFGDTVRRGVSVAALLLTGLAAASAAHLVANLIGDFDRQAAAQTAVLNGWNTPTYKAIMGAFGTAGVLGLITFVVAVRASLTRSLLGSRAFWLGVAAILALFIPAWIQDADAIPILAGGALLAIAVPLFLVIGPLLRSYPSLRRLLPVRAAFVVAAAALIALDLDAILVALALLGLVLIYLGGKYVLRSGRRRAVKWSVFGEQVFLRYVLLVSSLWPFAVVGALAYFGPGWLADLDVDVDLGLQYAAQIIIAIELLILTTAVALFIVAALFRARRAAPRFLLPAGVLAFAATGVASAYFEDFFSDGALEIVGESLLACYVGLFAGLTLTAVAILVRGSGQPDHDEVREALRARDARGKCARNTRLFRVMAVSELPGIGQIAEATQAPFYKSFVTVEMTEAEDPKGLAVIFSVFGVEDEREVTATGHPALASPGPRGSYLVDRVTITVPDPPTPCVFRRRGRPRPR